MSILSRERNAEFGVFGGRLMQKESVPFISQDSKVIQIRNNRVADFLMNDKCAAGTGRFLSMACDTRMVCQCFNL